MAPEMSTLNVALQKAVMELPTNPVRGIIERLADAIVSLGTKKNENCDYMT